MAKEYLVIGKDIKTGKKVFYDIDDHSGGYPFVSTFDGATTSDIMEAIGWMKASGPDSTYSPMKNAAVYEIVHQQVDVSKYVDLANRVDGIISGLSEAEAAEALKQLSKR